MSEIQTPTVAKHVTCGEAAELMGVTHQTVRNWCKRGMHEMANVGTSPRGHAIYDLEKIRQWAKDNTGWVHGGKRTGAGRKPGLWAAAAAKPVTGGRPAERFVPDGDGVGFAGEEDLFALAEVRSIDDLMRLAAEGKLPPARVQALKALWDAKAKEREHKIKMGQLVDAEEMTRDLTQFLSGLRRDLESMSGRMSHTVCQQANVIEPEAVQRVREVIQAEVDRFVSAVYNFGSGKGEKAGKDVSHDSGN